MDDRKANQGTFRNQSGYEALARLMAIGQRDTGQSRKVADFLLAWHNADENGGWNPFDLCSVDAQIADDMLSVLQLVREGNYPDSLGFGKESANY